MNENKKMILTDIIGMIDLNSSNAKNNLMWNFNDIDVAFQDYEIDFKDEPELLKDILECHKSVINIYETIKTNYIKEFAETVYGQSIDFIINTYSQEDILMRLESFLKTKGVPNQFKIDVYDNIKELAIRLDKRFSFDEVALINLIEASSGNNIINEEQNRAHNNKVLLQTGDGYKLERSTNKSKYTQDGSDILNPNGQQTKEEEKIHISSFPLGNKFSNTDHAMKKVMQILFENLNLCIETYNTIYSSGDNIVKNTASLADGTTFDFEYIINENNLPHLLGIPNPRKNPINQKSIDFLNIISGKRPIELSQRSSALDVLKVIYFNQNSIIESSGLYEENGKKYEILNWEKIILKTSSFMRGDFFKTCFCLTKLANDKYLASQNERGSYLSISATEYNKGLNSSRSPKAILNDLLNTRRQKRDFIFRGFVTDDGKQRVNSIMTGKAETIHYGRRNELLRTLQRYRNTLFGSSDGWYMTQNGDPVSQENGMPFDDNPMDKDLLFGSIVEEIENEKFIRKFTPEEQAELGISISRDLSLIPTLSREAMDVIQGVHSYNGAITSKEIDEFDRARTNGRSKK